MFGGLGGGGSIGSFPGLDGVNDGPWNERLPVSVGSGPSINIGGVYGGGNTGPFIFTLEQQAGYQESWRDRFSDWVAGAGDTLTTIPFTTFSVTAFARKHTPGGDSSNPCSSAYRAGGWTGTGLSVAIGGAAGLAKSGAKTAADQTFSHFVPQRVGRAIGGEAGDFIQSRSPLNGNWVSKIRHYKHDPYYYGNVRGAWREWGDKLPTALAILDRTPDWFKGAAAGFIYAVAGSGGCPGN